MDDKERQQLIYHYHRQRAFDIKYLWPRIKRQSLDLDRAKAAMADYAMCDEAWLVLGNNEIILTIDRLE